MIALRALGIAPNMTQEAFFTDAAESVRSELRVTVGGMSLVELGALLEAHGAGVRIVHASEIDVDRFRAAAAKNLADGSDVMLVNYGRERLGQGRPGHISPLAAYDEKSDRVLVLDTATYQWPATWIAIADLFGAMRTIDPASGESRGYVEVSRRRPRVSASAGG